MVAAAGAHQCDGLNAVSDVAVMTCLAQRVSWLCGLVAVAAWRRPAAVTCRHHPAYKRENSGVFLVAAVWQYQYQRIMKSINMWLIINNNVSSNGVVAMIIGEEAAATYGMYGVA